MSQHIIMSEESGTSRLETAAAPVFEPLDFSGWKGAGLSGSGLFMFTFEIAPAAVDFPLHADEAEWLAYVVEGSGELLSGDPKGNETGSVEYSAGDYITFHANTQHAWKNGGTKGKILFVKKA